jgi:hypothetical protein
LVATVVDTGSGRSSGRLCQRASSKRIPSWRWLVLLFVILLRAICGQLCIALLCFFLQ